MKKIGHLLRYKAVLTGNSRIVTMEGREYLVYKVVILMEGVHHGSTGPIMYFAKDMAKYAAAWNHKPIVKNHPRRNGFFISADDPQVLSEFKVGILMANRVISKKQHAEAWLERDRAEKIIPDVLKRLARGESVEVSTGLFSSLENKKGEWKGEKFEGIAREYRPDHLAILPNTTGACSVSDGCGLFTAAQSASLVDPPKAKSSPKRSKRMKVNCSCKKGTAMTKKQKVAAKKLIGNMIAGGHWTKKDRPLLEGIKDFSKLKKIAALGAPEDDDDEDDDKPRRNSKDGKKDDKGLPKGARQVDNKSKTKTKKKTVNSLTRETRKFLKGAPAEVRELLGNGLKAHRAERARLSDIILSNEENLFDEDELEKMELNQLKKLAALAVHEDDDDDFDLEDDYDFVGSAGAPRGNSRGRKGDDDEPVLSMPTMNWDEDKKKE